MGFTCLVIVIQRLSQKFQCRRIGQRFLAGAVFYHVVNDLSAATCVLNAVILTAMMDVDARSLVRLCIRNVATSASFRVIKTVVSASFKQKKLSPVDTKRQLIAQQMSRKKNVSLFVKMSMLNADINVPLLAVTNASQFVQLLY
jgi:hypothetical protein